MTDDLGQYVEESHSNAAPEPRDVCQTLLQEHHEDPQQQFDRDYEEDEDMEEEEDDEEEFREDEEDSGGGSDDDSRAERRRTDVKKIRKLGSGLRLEKNRAPYHFPMKKIRN